MKEEENVDARETEQRTVEMGRDILPRSVDDCDLREREEKIK